MDTENGKKLLSNLKKGKEIYEGFKNLLFRDEEIEKEAEEKLKTCFSCSSRKENKCAKCGCLIAAKARSPKSECPLKKW